MDYRQTMQIQNSYGNLKTKSGYGRLAVQANKIQDMLTHKITICIVQTKFS